MQKPPVYNGHFDFICQVTTINKLTVLISYLTDTYFIYFHSHITLFLHLFFSVYPYIRYQDENIPQHPCLRQVYNCEQVLNTTVSRRLVTMEKVKDFQVSVVSIDFQYTLCGILTIYCTVNIQCMS